MSDTREPIDMQAVLARIDRDLAESAKLREESNKFTVEQHKLLREAEKFRAEEQKLWRDWRLAPWILGLSLIGALLGSLIARHL